HDHHWVIFGKKDDISSRRWEGHYVALPEMTETAFRKASYSIDDLAERGCWWNRAYIEPEWNALFTDFEKVIFLDIDGVLNHTDGKNYIEKDLLNNLAEIVAQTHAELILTSSWRRYFLGWAQRGFPVEKDDFGWFLDDRLASVGLKLAGVTPVIFDGPEGRPFEVRRWLSRQGNLKRFVILDDEPFWKWNWLSPYVVETSDHHDPRWPRYVCGLNEQKMQLAINILNGTDTTR
ncbi:MAG: hypothetical protein IJ708_09515, partial [Clostridia bacterium]|nr:hypothetical protein [Clostridia bacterium]